MVQPPGYPQILAHSQRTRQAQEKQIYETAQVGSHGSGMKTIMG
jgi:hypothetical protein